MKTKTPPQPRVAGIVIGDSSLRVWGLTSRQRLQRQLARAGAVAADDASASRVVLLRADWVFDDALVRGLTGVDADCALLAPVGSVVDRSLPALEGGVVAVNVGAADAGESARLLADRRAPAAARRATPIEVAGAYNDTLRKRDPPYLLPLGADNVAAIERRVFGGAYKGVTDLVTLYVWPRPARWVTRLCADVGITPNQVTSASLALVFAAMALFWTGHYGWGLVSAWAMTFLDTVDGKLARVTLRSSKFGDVFDHAIDLVHPPFWWWAWIVGLPAAGFALERPSLVLVAIVAGYVLQRLEEGVFIACFGMDMHVWKRFDSKFRLITARRNPNLVLLSASVLVGRPDLGIVAVAVWTVASLVVHALRIVQAGLARRHGPLVSWLAAPG